MELQINNQTKTYQVAKLSIQDLLEIEKSDNLTGIAVAVNQLVIPKDLWATHFLQSGSSILIITATQGG
ncbi:sulfur carrier protein ThiS [Flavobacterium sp. NKUCC04_CG]|uniref:sulfur carrier protein ThiS n=1 Tax=Flavobacterium sp. NKUCC04_CG TaxID=2842121 RepID=UPI001C5B9E5F|nr:sulfur carrier protein ThiS [Flavobacterium sp. NKUCC04_CG]MBW3518596.1 sulfur carrier protein ThiS [Flavobacterium sp. NKUCC04_CG]